MAQWLNSYAHDAQFFTSRARWSNVKLMEAEDMSIGCFSPYPGSFLGAVVSQQLISEETKMAASVDSDCPCQPRLCLGSNFARFLMHSAFDEFFVKTNRN